MVEITGVRHGSHADRAGIRTGDVLVSVNGNEITDVLDYRFHICNEKLTVSFLRGEKEQSVSFKKEEYDDIGLEFETFLMDCKRSCRNKCIFCFIDQLPPGMRDTLYFKDDDSRLSFLQGNYITMTNLDDRDVDRIIGMHMSPINISVHTTSPELREKMLHNKNAGKVLSYLNRFAEAGIEMNGQIVLCRGVNDGEELVRTMHDLAALHPSMTSVSVVPAGMTKFRDGLYPLTSFSAEESAAVIRTVETFAEQCRAYYGSRIFYAADELYLEAGLPLHDGAYYEGYRQIENGVGMIASLRDEVTEALADRKKQNGRKRTVSLATGAAAYPLMVELAEKIAKKDPSLSVKVYAVENDFFGHSITVAGLVTGRDIAAQLRGKELGERLFLPASMLRYEKDRFLCGMSREELEKVLNVPITFCENDGYELTEALLRA